MQGLTRAARRITIDMIVLLLCSAVANATNAQVRWVSNTSLGQSYFLIAHQDDWQLFMGDVVVKTLKSGSPATFIYLTAGDDGRDSSYWWTRERAALASTRVAAELLTAMADSISCEPVTIGTHVIRKCTVGKTNSFFLRLPDGRRNGTGFVRYDNQSLRRLRSKRINSITAVDGSTTYQSWDDLVKTVSSLIDTTSVDQVLVHTMDPSIAVNPHDHFDHRMAGLLVADLRKQRALDTRYYVGYALSTHAANRSNSQAQQKTTVFLAYDQEMMRSNKDWRAYREHPAFYSDCMLRTYARSPRP
ncbi:MAG TPA: PIG-L family deacetylase [Gemmatimonadaceae bacterium]